MGLILPDSSIWIDHIRAPRADLSALLAVDSIIQHPFVTSEIALGSMRNRERIVAMLNDLPQVGASDQSIVLEFIEAAEIFGTGLGFVDAHLLMTASEQNLLLWSRDKRLAKQAERFGVFYAAG